MPHHDVLIAGTGVAAAAVASCLIDSGFSVLLLRKTPPGRALPRCAEILPPEANQQIELLQWQPVFASAGAVTVEGFENGWNAQDPITKPGSFLHVERTALAHSALAFVIARGAQVHDVHAMPSPGPPNADGIPVTLDGLERRFVAAIDATGRAAAWSRPLHFEGRHIAQLFEGPPGKPPLRGRIVSDPAAMRWAYRAGLRELTTIGVVSSATPPGVLDPSVAQTLGVPAAEFRFVGRRPAFPQWAADPALGRRLSVGDAAFASDPLAGQGIRFAMASALAAAAAVHTLARTADPELALNYHRDFVHSARRRHLRMLEAIRPGALPPVPETLELPAALHFTARPRLAALNIAGTLSPDTAYELPDGALVRWLGGFDLRRLARLANDPIPTTELTQKLQSHGLSPADACTLLTWCVNQNLLSRPLTTDN